MCLKLHVGFTNGACTLTCHFDNYIGHNHLQSIHMLLQVLGDSCPLHLMRNWLCKLKPQCGTKGNICQYVCRLNLTFNSEGLNE